jgi:hypothetical protein
MTLVTKVRGHVSVSASLVWWVLALAFCLGLGCDSSGGRKADEASGWDAPKLEAELLEVFGESDPYKRLLRLAEVVPQMTAENAPGAGSAMAKSELTIDRSESDPIMSRWVALDALAALEWTGTRGGAQGRDVIAQAIFSWVALDGGAGAVAYLDEVSPSTERFKIVRNNIIKGVGAAGDLSLATRFLGGIPDDETRQFMLLQLTIELSRRAGVSSKVWFESVPNDAPNGLKEAAFALILEIESRTDPESASQWYDSLGLKPYKRDNAVYSVGGNYALHDPVAGFNWMLSQPPSVSRQKALRDAAYLLLKKQPKEAFTFLTENMGNEGMGPTIYAFAHFYSSGDPQRALDWAIRVPEPNERDKAVLLPLQLLARRDLEAAQKWLAENKEHVSDRVRTKFEKEFGEEES